MCQFSRMHSVVYSNWVQACIRLLYKFYSEPVLFTVTL